MAARLTTGWLPAFWAATRRELAHWRGDRWELLLVTALPLLLMALMAWLFSASVMRGIPVALVDLDGSTVSRELTRAIDASPGVAVAMRCARSTGSGEKPETSAARRCRSCAA